MTIDHSTLTGTEVHEPKGADTATSGQVYVSDGLGSGSWADPLSSINNLNEFQLMSRIDDISTAGDSFFIHIPVDCELQTIRTVMSGAITVGDATISLYRDGVLLGQTMTVAFSGSGAGVTDSLTLSPTYAFTQGQTLEVRTDGGSTDVAKLFVNLSFSVA